MNRRYKDRFYVSHGGVTHPAGAKCSFCQKVKREFEEAKKDGSLNRLLHPVPRVGDLLFDGQGRQVVVSRVYDWPKYWDLDVIYKETGQDGSLRMMKVKHTSPVQKVIGFLKGGKDL